MKNFGIRVLLFTVIGLILYAGVYWWSETLVYKYGEENRFFKVKDADFIEYDYVILGSSHAMPFTFKDMKEQIQQKTDTKIINLSMPGAGVVLNRLIIEYFLTRHKTKNILYVLDSFIFYSRMWNEGERIEDVDLYRRAPFDPVLARLLLSYSVKRGVNIKVALNYISGFVKINNHDRFKPDIPEDEESFEKNYEPTERVDKERIDYLYPEEVNKDLFNKYIQEFIQMIEYLQSEKIEVMVIKTPLRKEFYELIPNEERFNNEIKEVLDKYDVAFYDFTLVCNKEEYFYNPDHLNREGMLCFLENHLKEVLINHRD
ncbi:MAG: hypothetical protein DRP87_01600 [Spirochaetes bacterium]|nr:MAG: hypothetical protein DRP87_01600 [Spirochaetota bacterium]